MLLTVSPTSPRRLDTLLGLALSQLKLLYARTTAGPQEKLFKLKKETTCLVSECKASAAVLRAV